MLSLSFALASAKILPLACGLALAQLIHYHGHIFQVAPIRIRRIGTRGVANR